MRTRKADDARLAEVTSRRLEALLAELALERGAPLTGAGAAATGRPAPGEPSAPDPPVVPVGGGRHAVRPLSPRNRLAGWLADRLPVSVTGGLDLGSAQLRLVALAVAGALLLGVWWAVRAAGVLDHAGEPVPPRPSGVPTAVATAASSAAGTPSPQGAGAGGNPGGAPTAAAPVAPATAAGTGASTGSPAQVVVDVVGKVRRPGIAILPAGSRVVDAVEASGGARPGVDLSSLNLARLLVDGEQVVVGQEAPAGVAARLLAGPSPAATVPSAAGPTALVNLNTADQATLETLPGVGPVTAAAILRWRTEHGSFTSVDELLEVSGIGDATLAELAPHVTL